MHTPGWARIYAWLWAVTLFIAPAVSIRGLIKPAVFAGTRAKFSNLHSWLLGIRTLVLHAVDNDLASPCRRNFFRPSHFCGGSFSTNNPLSQRPADLPDRLHGCGRSALDIHDLVAVLSIWILMCSLNRSVLQ